jgi:hypothetical protein
MILIPILIFPEHQQEENKEKEYQKLMTEEYVEESVKYKKAAMER